MVTFLWGRFCSCSCRLFRVAFFASLASHSFAQPPSTPFELDPDLIPEELKLWNLTLAAGSEKPLAIRSGVLEQLQRLKANPVFKNRSGDLRFRFIDLDKNPISHVENFHQIRSNDIEITIPFRKSQEIKGYVEKFEYIPEAQNLDPNPATRSVLVSQPECTPLANPPKPVEKTLPMKLKDKSTLVLSDQNPDHLILNFKWTQAGGDDLDIVVTRLDSKGKAKEALGFSMADEILLNKKQVAQWAHDNKRNGSESIYINLEALKAIPKVGSKSGKIQFVIAGAWSGKKGNGNVTIDAQAIKGGSVSANKKFAFQSTSSQAIDVLKIQTVITKFNGHWMNQPHETDELLEAGARNPSEPVPASNVLEDAIGILEIDIATGAVLLKGTKSK